MIIKFKLEKKTSKYNLDKINRLIIIAPLNENNGKEILYKNL